jgi:hypothetical protein
MSCNLADVSHRMMPPHLVPRVNRLCNVKVCDNLQVVQASTQVLNVEQQCITKTTLDT